MHMLCIACAVPDMRICCLLQGSGIPIGAIKAAGLAPEKALVPKAISEADKKERMMQDAIRKIAAANQQHEQAQGAYKKKK